MFKPYDQFLEYIIKVSAFKEFISGLGMGVGQGDNERNHLHAGVGLDNGDRIPGAKVAKIWEVISGSDRFANISFSPLTVNGICFTFDTQRVA